MMQTYHLVQQGPAFANDLDATLQRSGQYVVKTKSHQDGRDTQTVHIVAFTPEPRVIGLEIAPTGSERVLLGTHPETAVHFKLKPKLGVALKLFATVAGKAPPDSDVWIVTDDVPAFVRFEGPMYSGPVWRLSLASPSWSSEEPRSR